ncbi:MAG: ferrochelatase [Planctomycetota bacterium]|jgi:ferrochelatase
MNATGTLPGFFAGSQSLEIVGYQLRTGHDTNEPRSLATLFMKTGVLLINLGTPDAPQTAEVRRYLRQFLSDPRVLDMPAPIRWLLVNLVITPRRAPASAEAYRKVWTDRGSPLYYHLIDLCAGLREALPEVIFEVGMRYGSPSIATGLNALRTQGCDRILVAPLYPQYASSATGTALEAVYREASKLWNTPYIQVLPAFYDDPHFLDAFAALGKEVLDEFKPDHVLFSYHGLPERHCTKSDDSGAHCLRSANCCERMVAANQSCYRAQCFATTKGLRERLMLDESNSSISFQSRLGRTPWIQPYTDKVLVDLPAQGVKRLAVYCPTFVADCLETLEEIEMRGAEDFLKAGGEELRLIPSLNASPAWVAGLAAMFNPLLALSPEL